MHPTQADQRSGRSMREGNHAADVRGLGVALFMARSRDFPFSLPPGVAAVKLRALIATALQAVGILTIAAGVGFVSFWGGLLALGVGLVLFGVAIERGE